MQSYETIGDYNLTSDGVEILISDMGNPAAETAVALHELIELTLCRLAGISFGAIDAFDIQFERDARDGLHPLDAEPGDDPQSPYYAQHQFATALERLFVQEAGLDWNVYEALISDFWRKEYPRKTLD